MDEYIEREKMLEDLRLQFCKGCNNYSEVKCKSCSVDDVIGFVEDLPTADVVEVVRCKDCKHGDFYCSSILCGNAHAPWYNDEFDALMELDDYCSYGERRCEE